MMTWQIERPVVPHYIAHVTATEDGYPRLVVCACGEWSNHLRAFDIIREHIRVKIEGK